MEIRFIGPLGKVTGSCCWMRDSEMGCSFLIDCGMQQGESTEEEWNSGSWAFVPSEIQFVALTHAHIDHCGLLPLLYKDGFDGTVYCTRETAEVAKILLKDAARLSQGRFSEKDVDKIKWHEPRGKGLVNEFHPVGENLFLMFQRTGHVIGAVAIRVYWGPRGQQKCIVFSGDVGSGQDGSEHLPFIRYPMGFNHPDHKTSGIDYAVLESTYGGKVRNEEERNEDIRRNKIADHLDRILKTNGTLLIPAFAFGRTMDVLYDLHWLVAENPEKYGAISYWLDSPTAVKLRDITLDALKRNDITRNKKVRRIWLGKQFFRRHGLNDSSTEDLKYADVICDMVLTDKDEYDGATTPAGNAISRSWRPIMRHVKHRNRSNVGTESGPNVLVVSSGSCDGGTAAYWLPKVLKSHRNTVLLTGYVGPASIGGKIMELKDIHISERKRLSSELAWNINGGKRVSYSDIEAEIDVVHGYSAHADQKELVDWALCEVSEGVIPTANTIFLQHGGDAQRKALKDALEGRANKYQLNLDVQLPDQETGWLNLDVMSTAGTNQSATRKAHLERELVRIQKELLAYG